MVFLPVYSTFRRFSSFTSLFLFFFYLLATCSTLGANWLHYSSQTTPSTSPFPHSLKHLLWFSMHPLFDSHDRIFHAALNKFKPSEMVVTSSPTNFPSIYSVSTFSTAEHINNHPCFQMLICIPEQWCCACMSWHNLQEFIWKIQREEIINMLIYGNVSTAAEDVSHW